MLNEELGIYEKRCVRFLERTKQDRYGETIPFQAVCARSTDPVPYAERMKLDYRPITEGEQWGDTWDSAWFHLTAVVPKAWQGKEIACNLNFSGEALIFDETGVPEWSLTGQSAMDTQFEKYLYLPPAARFHDGKIDLWIETAANSLFGAEFLSELNSGNTKGKFPGLVLAMKIGIFHREAWQLRFDFEVLFSLARTLPADDYRRRQLLAALNRAVDVYAYDPVNAAEARAILAPLLARPAISSAVEVTAVGHAHIDVGWLWPVRESVRKTARTFASQLKLMETYPGYTFGASQPQLYAFVRDYYPELYIKIKAAVKAGNWELQGGMWVEADCNIIGGESMVRQFIHGKNFFMDEFGVDVKNLWLPDVFGYAATLPQIIRKSGCDYFLTQKISWNQYNRFPYHSFVWEGIDGSSVLTHFPPEDTYNAHVLPDLTIKGQNNCTESDIAPMAMSLYGIGDGGGGPSEMHVERALRVANLEGCPKYRFGRADEFFPVLERAEAKLPKWRGELYLEMHRGTLTSQARTKCNNRKLEQALSELEFVAAALPLDRYPAAELDKVWKTLLINQFHDIIPGSSIHWVYEVTEAEHAEARATVARLLDERLPQLGGVDADAAIAVNSLPYAYRALVTLPADWAGRQVVSPSGFTSIAQAGETGATALVELAPCSISTLRRGAAGAAEAMPVAAAGTVLENALVRYEFDRTGELVSGYDKTAGREILVAGGKGNRFTLQTDRPNDFDAWDVDPGMDDEKQWHTTDFEVSPVTSGPVEASFRLSCRIGKSTLEQRISLRANAKRLDFATHVDWHERQRMLRVNFPVDVFASEASFEIQYGFLKRPVNTNTSWEKAKYEVVGQRYADLSEPGYGVALLNDCKYGYRTNQGELELCLLRSPIYPDPIADQGEHFFTYSLLPHTGTLTESEVMAEAAMLNRVPALLPGYAAQAVAPFALDGLHVNLEVVKRAEKSAQRVLRLVETAGARSKCVLTTTLGDVTLTETNLLEWTRGERLAFSGGRLELELKPFEIRTYLVD